MTTKTSVHPTSIARRDFLKTGGALVVTFSMSGGTTAAMAATTTVPSTKTVALDQVDGFLAIDAKGGVTVYSGKVDLGTGIRTAMAQIAAEELSVPLDRVTVIQGDTMLTPDQGITWGSLSIQSGGMQIRQAAATARQALLAEGARTLRMDSDAVAVRDGVVSPKTGGKGVSYAALVGGRDFSLAVDPKAPLKDPKEYVIVGKSIARIDIPDKVTGRFTYMHDFKRKGMLHARVVRPAAMKATLQAWNDFDCRKVPGYVGAVKKGNFLAVLGRTEWAAIAASRAIQTTWSSWAGLPDQTKLWEYVRGTKVNKDEELQKIGDAVEALKTPNAKIVNATLRIRDPHARVDRTIVCGRRVRRRQADCLVRIAADPPAAQADREDVRDEARGHSLHLHRGRRLLRSQRARGRRGRRGADREGNRSAGTRAMDAAGRARLGPEGPADAARLQGGARRQGQRARLAVGSLPSRPTEGFRGHPAAQRSSRACRTSPRIRATSISRSAIPYTFPNVRAMAHWLAETPFRPSWIRTPGRMQNTFGNESFVDEIAVAAGVDPLEFRLKHLKDARGVELLQGARRACGLEAVDGASGRLSATSRAAAARVRQVRAGAHLRRRGGRRRGQRQDRQGAR